MGCPPPASAAILAYYLLPFGEVALAGWLFCRWLPRSAHAMALGVLLSFSVVALWLALDERASCGCFGALETSPRVMVVIDLGLAAAFAATLSPAGRLVCTPRRAMAVPLVILLWFGSGWVLARHLPATSSGGAPGGFDLMAAFSRLATARVGGSEVVMLNPAEWVGRPVPWETDLRSLPSADDNSDSLTMLFYRAGCPAC